MPVLYIRTTVDGKRTWQKVGHYHSYDFGRGFLSLQVSPGKVYRHEITADEVTAGTLHKGR